MVAWFRWIFLLLLTLLPLQAMAVGRVFTVPPRQLPIVLQRVVDHALRLRSVRTGPRNAPHILVFFDPDCPFCAHLWQSLQPWRKELRVRWIPVAYVRHSSLGRAAAILTAPQPEKALEQNEGHFAYRQHLGGLMPLFDPPAPLQTAIRHNTQFWLQNIATLPALFYEDRNGAQLFLGSPTPYQWRQIIVSASRKWPES